MAKSAGGPLAVLDDDSNLKAYRRWAPIYDKSFGKVAEAGLRQTAERANAFAGRLLEVGVGTGLALPFYKPHLSVTGIDLSAAMLAKARHRLEREGLAHVESLLEMDAAALTFPDASFDIAVAAYVMTVVPEPRKVMAEMARVVKPGGTVLVCSHFKVERGILAVVEKRMKGFADILGWRPDFPLGMLMGVAGLELVSTAPVRPFGFFTLLEFRRITPSV